LKIWPFITADTCSPQGGCETKEISTLAWQSADTVPCRGFRVMFTSAPRGHIAQCGPNFRTAPAQLSPTVRNRTT
jgi:hypothetical protein